MAGHSKWAQIKHKKQKEDAKRGILFTKLIREITVAAREGGNPDINPKLRRAIENAKSAGMPKENIERAIKRGTGELPGVHYEKVVYEGYSPGGSAIFIEAITDSKNRTTAGIRHIFNKYGGNLGQSGCVAWMFKEKGIIYVEKEKTDEDTLVEICIEGGGEDVKDEGDMFYITMAPEKLEKMKELLNKKKIPYRSAEITKLPQTIVGLKGKEARQTLKIMNSLEEMEDVQKVYSNFDIPEEILKEEVE
jgi:YebC/PmpR family DNA-binding regulatory protein